MIWWRLESPPGLSEYIYTPLRRGSCLRLILTAPMSPGRAKQETTMKQAIKWIDRTMKDRRYEISVVRRFRRLLAMIEQGSLIPVAQSHREIAIGGIVFVERRTGVKWACTHGGMLDSLSHGLWDVCSKGPEMPRVRAIGQRRESRE